MTIRRRARGASIDEIIIALPMAATQRIGGLVEKLRSLPVDILKVDKSFVAALDGDGKSRDLFEAILGVGQALSLSVVAEGIEAQSQMTALKEMGCDLAQGFLMGKPSPAEVAESLLEGGFLPARAPLAKSSQGNS